MSVHMKIIYDDFINSWVGECEMTFQLIFCLAREISWTNSKTCLKAPQHNLITCVYPITWFQYHTWGLFLCLRIVILINEVTMHIPIEQMVLLLITNIYCMWKNNNIHKCIKCPAVTLIQTVSFMNENGTGGSSPSCTSQTVKSMLRPSSRGGVPKKYKTNYYFVNTD